MLIVPIYVSVTVAVVVGSGGRSKTCSFKHHLELAAWKQYSGSLYVQSLRVRARVRARVTAQALRPDQIRPDQTRFRNSDRDSDRERL